MGFFSKLTSKISSAERNIPKTSNVVTRMKKIRNNSRSKLSNLKGRAGNRLGSLRKGVKGSLNRVKNNLSKRKNNASKYSSILYERSSSRVGSFFKDSFEGSKRFYKKSRKRLGLNKNNKNNRRNNKSNKSNENA